jgi:hypothetical protein
VLAADNETWSAGICEEVEGLSARIRVDVTGEKGTDVML